MHPSVSASGAVPGDHGLLLDDALSEYSTSCIRKRTLFRSIEYLWNAMLPIMKQVTDGKSRLENKSRNFEPSTLPPPKQ